MNKKDSINFAARTMLEFAERTGLTSNQTPVRYLWTDAFAVCNYFALHKSTGDASWYSLALKLIDQVHETLGRQHPKSGKSGYLSGLDPLEARQHPTVAGLRIGKEEDERPPEAPYDPEKEWDRDGQYFHYLTKWMHALALAAEMSDDQKYLIWAAELAKTAHRAFTYRDANGELRMYWKMSIDLSRPLVPSMGQHDPLDGLVTYSTLQRLLQKCKIKDWTLVNEISDFRGMCLVLNPTTDDPLGLGGLLSDSFFLSSLIAEEFNKEDEALLERMLTGSARGMASFLSAPTLHYPAAYRLAFRELGLSIGLHGLEKAAGVIDRNGEHFSRYPSLRELLDINKKFVPVGEAIELFWMDEENRKAPTWTEHLNINSVMLATALLPDGYLQI